MTPRRSFARFNLPQTINGACDVAHSEFRVVLYSHDTMGLGHVRRNQLIALALTEAVPEARILLVAGAHHAACLDLPPGVDCLTLPNLRKTSDGLYDSRFLDVPVEQLVAMRHGLIRAAVETFDPDLFVADKAPRGASGELDAALSWLKRRGRARCVLGLRDVLDDPAAVRRDWRQGRYERAIEQYYDDIWIYGDARVYDMADEYAWPATTSAKIQYLGYLDQSRRLANGNGAHDAALDRLHLPGGSLVVCTVGGGQDGEELAAAFLQAELPPRGVGVLITGPFMPHRRRAALEQMISGNPRRRIIEFIPEADLLVKRADRLVTMGGYNSVCAALSFDKPALIVPRVTPRREQLIRARRLESLGLVDVLTPDAATPSSIGAWLAAPRPPRPRAHGVIDMNGLERLSAAVREVSSYPRAAIHG